MGKEIIPIALDSVYSITNSGREEYKMTNVGNTFDVIEYVNANIDLESLDN